MFYEGKEWDWSKTEETEHPKAGELVVNLKKLGNASKEVEIVQDNEEEEEEGEHVIDVDDEEDIEGDEEDDTQGPRQSHRVSTKPSYLDDYILLAEVEGERLLMIINDEP